MSIGQRISLPFHIPSVLDRGDNVRASKRTYAKVGGQHDSSADGTIGLDDVEHQRVAGNPWTRIKIGSQHGHRAGWSNP